VAGAGRPGRVADLRVPRHPWLAAAVRAPRRAPARRGPAHLPGPARVRAEHLPVGAAAHRLARRRRAARRPPRRRRVLRLRRLGRRAAQRRVRGGPRGPRRGGGDRERGGAAQPPRRNRGDDAREPRRHRPRTTTFPAAAGRHAPPGRGTAPLARAVAQDDDEAAPARGRRDPRAPGDPVPLPRRRAEHLSGRRSGVCAGLRALRGRLGVRPRRDHGAGAHLAGGRRPQRAAWTTAGFSTTRSPARFSTSAQGRDTSWASIGSRRSLRRSPQRSPPARRPDR